MRLPCLPLVHTILAASHACLLCCAAGQCVASVPCMLGHGLKWKQQCVQHQQAVVHRARGFQPLADSGTGLKRSAIYSTQMARRQARARSLRIFQQISDPHHLEHPRRHPHRHLELQCHQRHFHRHHERQRLHTPPAKQERRSTMAQPRLRHRQRVFPLLAWLACGRACLLRLV